MIRVYHHPVCIEHDPGAGHPECPDRLRVIERALRNPQTPLQLDWQLAPLGGDDQVRLVHDEAMLARIKATAPHTGRVSLDPDTHMSPSTMEAALRAVGAACQGVDDVMSGKADEVFCLTRPPGHHATPEQSMGFCVFNQIAIAAFHAQRVHGLERVAVVDFDVHHGNGTQDCVSGKAGLFYISTHQSPHYPGTGHAEDNRNFNILNLPLPSGTDDTTYRTRFTAEILPALQAYKPQLILVSAGFDAHQQDPLASLRLTENTYHWLGATLREVARQHCAGRLLSVLEGGYNLKVLGASVAAFLATSTID